MKNVCELSSVEMEQLPQDLHSIIKDACKMWSDVYFTVSLHPRLMLLYGPPGTFKSTMSAKHNLQNRSVERIPITPETCWPELRGYYGLGKEGMVWMDGPCTRAWRDGKRLVIDEINEAGGDTISGLHLITDGRSIASMTLPNGETVTPKESFQCFATMNATPQQLPEALNDRFAIKREVLFPDPRFLFGLPMKVRVAAAYCLFNKGASDMALRNLTTRSWVQIGEFMDKGHDLKASVQAVVGYKLVNAAVNAIEAAASKMTLVPAT